MILRNFEKSHAFWWSFFLEFTWIFWKALSPKIEGNKRKKPSSYPTFFRSGFQIRVYIILVLSGLWKKEISFLRKWGKYKKSNKRGLHRRRFQEKCQCQKNKWISLERVSSCFLLKVYTKMVLAIKPDWYVNLKYLGTKALVK